MQRHVVVVCLGAALGACAEPPVSPEDEELIEPGKYELPNGQYFERDHDGRSYRLIAAHFADEGFDVAVDLEALEPTWPMDNGETAVMTRFGTPLILSSTPYFHTALDVIRADPDASDQVFAPVSGPAGVFDWYGTRGYNGDAYSTIVAIYDEQSGAVAQLMHVEPSEELQAAGSGLIDVQAGDLIGTLASDLSWFADPGQRNAFRHTHLSIIDGANVRSLDPARFLPYADTTAPQLVDTYVLDEDAQRHPMLVSGAIDVVIEVFDRDETSDRNFEIDAISYEIVDDTGTVLRELERCDIDDLYADTSEPYRLRTLQLLDFGNAQGQVDNSWPSSDIGNRERTFRYGLTQLTHDEQGQCDVLTDSAGFVDIPDATQWIELRGTMWDVRDNATPFEVRLSRTEVVEPDPDPEPEPDEEPWTELVESVELPQGGEHHTATPIVPAGTYRFAIEGTGDGDLYVRVADAPTLDTFDCRPYQWGSQEECIVVLEEPAPIHAMVHGYEDCAVTITGARAQ